MPGLVTKSNYYSEMFQGKGMISLFFRKVLNSEQVEYLSRQKPSFDSAQDDVTLSGVEVLSTLNFLYIYLFEEKELILFSVFCGDLL
jgi:hypothetical protein